jgi:CDP-6-deoxy-D-xylo-4-hexulose-3-dehydrase
MQDKDFVLRDRIEMILSKNKIEFRRGSAGGGNQLRQPFLKDHIKDKEWEDYPETEHIHHFCWYVGNYPSLEEEKIIKLCELLNQA